MTNEPNNKYDVFLCLVGPDTRYTFAGNLYNALRRNRINTFFTEDNHHHELLMNGDQISPFALRVIKESNLLIVVLSPNYASSPRNLDEFVAIVRCIKREKQLMLPVFYKVERHEIRDAIYGSLYKDQQTLCVFEERFGDYKERVNEWKNALSQVFNWTRMEYQNGSEYEYEFIQKIVNIAQRFQCRYDVFLSFRGRDTRHSFTGFLYKAFCREGFYVFMDDEGLEGGNQISPTIMRAIEASDLSIVVFSENYGYSTWCLEELSKVIECMKTRNQMVWPIFYNVEKSDVCNQTKSYGDAMTAHEKRFGKDSEKVHKWRSALSEIANLEGEHLRENEYQYEFIERIVEKAINITSPCSNDSYKEE